jgi:hypothetical protein
MKVVLGRWNSVSRSWSTRSRSIRNTSGSTIHMLQKLPSTQQNSPHAFYTHSRYTIKINVIRNYSKKPLTWQKAKMNKNLSTVCTTISRKLKLQRDHCYSIYKTFNLKKYPSKQTGKTSCPWRVRHKSCE